jgi:hypothetical protein
MGSKPFTTGAVSKHNTLPAAVLAFGQGIDLSTITKV